MIELTTSYPLFVTGNLEAQKSFYESMFGFRAVFFEADFYLHLLHPGGGTQLGFMRPDHPTQPEFLRRQAGREGMVITVEVADVRAALASAEAAGLDLAMGYKEEPWGQTHFMVRDPAGFVIDIVEHQAP